MIVEHYSYDVFGEPNRTSDVNNPYMFTGRRYDPEAGLYYYRARYYAHDIGRFLQIDPIGYDDGMNLYTYVGNNPINSIDPTGKFSIVTVAISVTIGAILIGISSHYYFQNVVRSLPKTVVVQISIDSSKKPGSWNTPVIQQELEATMAPCFNHLSSGQGVRLELVEEANPSRALGWRIENGVKLEYNGRVDFGPTLGLAFSSNGQNTTIDVSDVEIWATAFSVNWDVLWANFLAHEQLWLSMSRKVDNLGAEDGEISSNTASVSRHANITEKSCKAIIKAMQMKHR